MVRRYAAAALIVLVAGILLIAAWPQLFGLQFQPIVAQVVSLRGMAASIAAVVALILLLLALAVRPFRRLGASLAILLVLFVGVNAAVLATRGFDGSTAERAGSITVLAWNTLGDAPGAAAIAELGLSTGADIVSLPETSEETADDVAARMTAAGRPMTAHTLAFNRIAKAKSTSVLVSTELGSYSQDSSRGSTSVVPTLVMTSDDGSGPTIIAAHPVAPITGYLDAWQADLRWLATACTGENIIMAGDLNSTIDHYGPLANTTADSIGDCRDAALHTGDAAAGTWPANLPAVLGAPIDHVMATAEWTATSVSVIEDRDDSGSDHRPIVATLAPAG